MSLRLLYNKILTSVTVIIECISWLINVTDNNDARWKPAITLLLFSKEDTPLTMVMIFVSISIIVEISDKRDSRKTIYSRLKVSFRLNQSKNSIYSLYPLHYMFRISAY